MSSGGSLFSEFRTLCECQPRLIVVLVFVAETWPRSSTSYLCSSEFNQAGGGDGDKDVVAFTDLD